MSQQEEFHNKSSGNLDAENPTNDQRHQRRNSLLYETTELPIQNAERKASIDATIESIAKNTAANTQVNVLRLDHSQESSLQDNNEAVANHENDLLTQLNDENIIPQQVQQAPIKADEPDVISGDHFRENTFLEHPKDENYTDEHTTRENIEESTANESELPTINESYKNTKDSLVEAAEIAENDASSVLEVTPKNDSNFVEEPVSYPVDPTPKQSAEQHMTLPMPIEPIAEQPQGNGGETDIIAPQQTGISPRTELTHEDIMQADTNPAEVETRNQEILNTDINFEHSMENHEPALEEFQFPTSHEGVDDGNHNEDNIPFDRVEIEKGQEEGIQTSLPWDVPNERGHPSSDHESFPWETNKVEGNEQEENQVTSQWDLPKEEQQSNEQESLPWETNQLGENKLEVEQQSLPFVHQQFSDHGKIPCEQASNATTGHQQLSEHGELPWDQPKHDSLLSEEDSHHISQGQPEGDKLQPEDNVLDNTANMNKEPFNAEHNDVEFHQGLINENVMTQDSSALAKDEDVLPWIGEHSGANERLPWEDNDVKEEGNLKIPDEKLENLLDDNDFIEMENAKNIQDSLTSKNEKIDLDLDLDDDLLLDEEFLDEEPKSTPMQVPPATAHFPVLVPEHAPASTKPKLQHNKYAATESKPKQFDVQSYEKQKKMSNAYDLPSEIVGTKNIPYNRTNKYSAGIKIQSSPIPGTNVTNKPATKPLVENNTKPLVVKPFYEELPIDLTKITKATRAAPVKALNHNAATQTNIPQNNITPTSQAPPIGRNAPVNPYAKLGKQVPVNNQVPVVPTPPKQVSNIATPNARSNNQYAPLPHLSPINTVTNSNLAPQSSTQNQAPVRNFSNPSPNFANSTITKQQQPTSATSPYVPNTGPYAPSSRRTHVRSNSLIGGKGKEVNPYVPISTNPNVNLVQNQNSVPASNLPIPHLGARPRKVSNPRPSIYAKSHPAQKLVDPNIGFHKQFPIFTWSNSQNVVSLVPNIQANTYHKQPGEIHVRNINEVLDLTHFLTFPGPLSKMSKKKDIEKWLESNIHFLNNDFANNEMEIIVARILLELVKHNSDMNSKDLIRAICTILNPAVDYYSEIPSDIANNSIMISNASKLDSAGINIVFSMIQVGKVEKALEYAISRGDWALSLIMANIVGEERYSKIVSDYSRFSFPFQKSNNKVHHLMPIILKLSAGSVKSVIDDFSNVQTEKEWALMHWREIIAVTLIMESPKSLEFIMEFGKLLAFNGYNDAATIAFMLCGRPLSPIQSTDNIQFSLIQMSILYTELYEHILSNGPNSNQVPLGLPHLLPMKLKHASLLADYGHFAESQKYIDLVNNMIKTFSKSPYVTATLVQEFQNLIIRVSETGNMEQGWFSGKISKVNLDKVWGQIDKFIGGDESLAKSNEGGVFSKFSPSISRTASTLDFTATPLNIPPIANIRRDSLPLASENQIPPTIRSKSSINPYGSTSKYSIQAKAGNSVAPVAPVAPIAPMASSNDVYPSVPISRYAHSNASSQSLPASRENVVKNDHEQKRYPAKYNPAISKDNDDSRTYSPVPVNHGFSDFNQQPYVSQPAIKELSVPSVTSADYNNMDSIRKLNHSPSVQSEVSIDFPSEFRTSSKKEVRAATGTEMHSATSNPSNIGNIGSVDVISEAEEKSESTQSLNNANGVIPTQTPSNKSLGDLTNNNSSTKPATLTTAPPPPISKKANPYAPKSSSSNRQESRKSKYGPTSSNKLKYVSHTPRPLGDEVPQLNISDAPAENSGDQNTRNAISVPPTNSFNNNKEEIRNETGSYFQPASDMEKNSLNKNEDGILTQIDQNAISTPERRKSIFLKENQSPTDPAKASMFNPYNKPKKEVTSVLDTSFGEFSIPGSPEYTTRANSVIGGPSFFTSRLSESQQSALYQQYEVRDDTVRDYIPPVEEEEEEDDEDIEVASVKTKEKEKEKEKEKLNVEHNSKGNPKQDGSKGSIFLWFSKNDGKPKPVRANLGEENMFYYSEEHKRYINKNIPIEDQIKESKPPPPPIAKKPMPATPQAPVPNTGMPPSLNSTPKPSAPGAPGAPGVNSTEDSSLASLPPKPKTGPSLANAGLEDLLSLGGSSSSVNTARKPRKGGRRGYVNVFEQKN